LHTELNVVLKSLGAKELERFRQNAVLNLSTIFLQLCPESLEYPRSNGPPNLRFTGGIPRKTTRAHNSSELLGWWNDIVDRGDTQIVAFLQGTVALKPENHILPTLEALKD
jgi:hypothetical protein